MKYESMSSVITIQDPRAAAVFAQSQLRRILLQFSLQPRSIAEVGRDLNIQIKQLHQLVTKFLKLGLLVVVDERKRAGRAIRLYQTAAQRFFIPSAATPVQFSKGLAKELRESLARDAAGAVKGMVFSLDEDGRVSGEVIEKPGASFVPLDSWRILRLSAASVARLKSEMSNVLDRFQSEADTGGQVYLIHAGMARPPAHTGATDNLKPPANPR